jgi:3-hydroxyacyl-CoA dehydrogenase
VWAAGGYNVAIRDPSADQRNAAIHFIDNNIAAFAKQFKDTNPRRGDYAAYEDLDSAVKNAWFVVEAVPEKLDLKIATFTELAQKAPKDCIMGSNSSSYKSRLMVENLDQQAKERVLNVHYTMPPIRVVELMTSTFTHPDIFPFLENKHRQVGLLPATARVESTG